MFLFSMWISLERLARLIDVAHLLWEQRPIDVAQAFEKPNVIQDSILPSDASAKTSCIAFILVAAHFT